LLYQEIALLRFLIGHGFKLLFSPNETTAATWKSDFHGGTFTATN
jgi:hypothetical protein